MFTDPALFALAEPYVSGPDVQCVTSALAPNVQESVGCVLADGRIGLFYRMLTVESMIVLREGYRSNVLSTAQPGTIRSLRWRFTDGGPGAKTGIPVGRDEPGEGVRVRFFDTAGMATLYFDQESSRCYGLLIVAEGAGVGQDLDALRAYWADPSR